MSDTKEDNELEAGGTLEASIERSHRVEEDLLLHPAKYRVLTGDRPTGRLHIGHYFGSLQNRVRLQNLGVETFILIADLQVLTDHDSFENISEYTKQLVIDYLAAGIDPNNGRTHIFMHSQVPEANQLLLPFLTLVSNAELDRNPTVKEELQAAGIKNMNAGMYTYPVHQAADILFCKANVVPVGKDQLPHIELCRQIARRFNSRYAHNQKIFPEPVALLSKTPMILGLDGGQKMSKSRNNAIFLSSTEDETVKLVKKAKTDAERLITYEPERRPEVANLLLLVSLCSGEDPASIAARIGDSGAGKLKELVSTTLNEYLRPVRARRAELEKDPGYIKQVLQSGIDAARSAAQSTLSEVRDAMNMNLNF